MRILAVDIGGTKVKLLASGQTEPRKATSGKALTPTRLVELVAELAADWDYEALSIGYPGLVGDAGPISEPANLGPGWVGFDFAAAFEHPVKILNDAAMQALGSYEGGRMLFLGLGTGLGSALISGRAIVPLELGRLRFRRGQMLGAVVSREGLKRLGKTAWREAVAEMTATLMAAFVADYVVLGGGNAKLVQELPPGVRRGHNRTAFRGGFRLWGLEEVPAQSPNGAPVETTPPTEWRLV
jgi:polyphosphate glucokinase